MAGTHDKAKAGLELNVDDPTRLAKARLEIRLERVAREAADVDL